MRRDAVRTYQWQFDLDDASGIEGEWRDPHAPLGPGVVALLELAGDTYLPFLTANAAAIAAGARTYDLKLNGKSYPNPTRSYKRRCLLWLKAALAEVKGEARARLEKTLKQYHCWEPLQFSPGEEKMVPPLVPL